MNLTKSMIQKHLPAVTVAELGKLIACVQLRIEFKKPMLEACHCATIMTGLCFLSMYVSNAGFFKPSKQHNGWWYVAVY